VQIPANLGAQLDDLAAALADPAPFRHAAVLAALLPGAEPRIVLIERAGNLRAHAGQLAFPGGKPEPTDRDLLETALREAEEEVYLPRAQVRVLGRLHPVPVPTGFVVVPFVGLVEGDWSPRWDEGEVKAVLTPTLRELADPARYQYRGRREWMGVAYDLHEYQIHTPPLWGATARMVHDLLARLTLAAASPDMSDGTGRVD
jgi:8-oxo-dGTP pyrophosphatase MutT (NUDIX family)